MGSRGIGHTLDRFGIFIPVAPDEAERFKQAFDHLIKLHGGGGKELF